MPTCRYCGEEFDDEDAHLAHLKAAHGDELGRVDQRRVETVEAKEQAQESARIQRIAKIAAPVLLAIAVAGLVYALFIADSGGPVETGAAQEPANLWSVHTHGTMEMEILGDRVDFSQPQYQMRADAFHFENQEGQRWHVHAQDVTLEWALATLDIEVTDTNVTFQGTTYEDSDPSYDVTITVNGEDVEPSTYVLQEGDTIQVIVRNASN
jgi:hypothetical protein